MEEEFINFGTGRTRTVAAFAGEGGHGIAGSEYLHSRIVYIVVVFTVCTLYYCLAPGLHVGGRVDGSTKNDKTVIKRLRDFADAYLFVGRNGLSSERCFHGEGIE